MALPAAIRAFTPSIFQSPSLPNPIHIPLKLVFVCFANFGVMRNLLAFNNVGEFCSCGNSAQPDCLML
jgi:hypothetical protein